MDKSLAWSFLLSRFRKYRDDDIGWEMDSMVRLENLERSMSSERFWRPISTAGASQYFFDASSASRRVSPSVGWRCICILHFLQLLFPLVIQSTI